MARGKLIQSKRMDRFPILSAPERWHFVCSALPIEEQAVSNAAYARWAEAHRDQHNHAEILFCLEGETYERFAGRDYRCRPGSVFLFDADEAHAKNYPQDGKSFTHLWIMVLANDVIANVYCQRGEQSAEQRSTPMVLAKAECDLLARCWHLAKHPAAWMAPSLRRTVLYSAVFAIVFRAIDNWLTAPGGDDRGKRRQEIVAAVQRHIATHLSEAEDLDVLAHLSGYSKFHFSRIFKACTGETIHAFIDACRLRKSSELLKRGVLCKEVAAALGFSSPAAYSNWRRRQRV